jgi:hypothetical protein
MGAARPERTQQEERMKLRHAAGTVLAAVAMVTALGAGSASAGGWDDWNDGGRHDHVHAFNYDRLHISSYDRDRDDDCGCFGRRDGYRDGYGFGHHNVGFGRHEGRCDDRCDGGYGGGYGGYGY